MLKEVNECKLKFLRNQGFQVPSDLSGQIECGWPGCPLILAIQKHVTSGVKPLSSTSTILSEETIQIVISNRVPGRNECPHGENIG